MEGLQVKSFILLFWALMWMYSAAQREYFIKHENLTWSDARNYCQACFKDLVTLTPDNIQDIARNISSDHWIGLRKNFNLNNNFIDNLTSTPASYTVNQGTTQYNNSNSSSKYTRSPIFNWTQWANGDPLAFQNWYPGWPLPKPSPKPPKKTLCCSCSCTCPARTTTPATTPNVTDHATSFTDLTGITQDSSFSSFTDQTMTTQRTSQSFTTGAPSTTSEMPIEAQCVRSPMLEPKEPEDDVSNDVNYIEDSCVAMLSFGPWIEKNCLDLLPFICYDDRFIGQVNVTKNTSEHAMLTWMPAPGNINHYRVKITESNNEINSREWMVSVSNLAWEFTNLTAGTRYLVEVFPVKCERELNPESTSFYTRPYKVENLTISNVTKMSVILTWNKPGGNLDFYSLTYKMGQPNATTNTIKVNVTMQSQVVDGLTPGNLYNFAILSSVNDLSTYSDEANISAYTKPDRVYNLSVSNNNDSSLMVTWDQPNGNFTDILVVAKNSSNTTLCEEAVKTQPVTLTKLPPGTEMWISVTVRLNETMVGETQTIYSFTTPGPISNLSLTTSESCLNATWSPPVGSGLSFTVNLLLNGSVQETRNLTETRVSFFNLKNAANYTVEVRAVSGHFNSSPVTASKFTLPNAPENVRATIQNSSITYKWDPPKNSETSNYTVTLNSSFWGQSWSGETAETSYMFSGLNSGTIYFFEVRANAGGQQSKPVNLINCTVPDKTEVSLSMLCSSATPLLCDEDNTREDVFKQLMEFFSLALKDHIYWELEKTFK